MKKVNLLLIVLVAILTTNCKTDFPIEQLTEEEGKKQTTIELQELQKDTLIVSIVEEEVFIFDEENVLTHKLYTIDFGKVVPVRLWWAIVSWVCSIGFFVMLVNKAIE